MDAWLGWSWKRWRRTGVLFSWDMNIANGLDIHLTATRSLLFQIKGLRERNWVRIVNVCVGSIFLQRYWIPALWNGGLDGHFSSAWHPWFEVSQKRYGVEEKTRSIHIAKIHNYCFAPSQFHYLFSNLRILSYIYKLRPFLEQEDEIYPFKREVLV